MECQDYGVPLVHPLCAMMHKALQEVHFGKMRERERGGEEWPQPLFGLLIGLYGGEDSFLHYLQLTLLRAEIFYTN